MGQEIKNDCLNDITFIKELKHTVEDSWHQYDILMDARRYGWDQMLRWADYMTDADLNPVFLVRTGDLGFPKIDVSNTYFARGGKCSDTPELHAEKGLLAIAGRSITLQETVQIVMFNQTRYLRIQTPLDDELQIRKYAETMMRCSFGTVDAMKLGKPSFGHI